MTLKQINKKLKDLFGSLDGKNPTFRIVWSGDQYEDRFGEYEDYSEGGIFLRSYQGVRKVEKYQEDPPSYVLERMMPNPHPDEILGVLTTYEPLFFFKNDLDEQLPVEWKAVEFIMWNILYGPREAVKRALPPIGSKERDDIEHLKVMEFLDDASPYIAGMIHDRTAVVNAWGQPYYGGVK